MRRFFANAQNDCEVVGDSLRTCAIIPHFGMTVGGYPVESPSSDKEPLHQPVTLRSAHTSDEGSPSLLVIPLFFLVIPSDCGNPVFYYVIP